jgi:Hemerythrin HHE cation binding domain
MTAAVVRPTPVIPSPRTAADDIPPELPSLRSGQVSRAVAYQRVLHRLVRRELRLLAELGTWASPGETDRAAALTKHAELVGRVLLHHHRVERDAVWPALLRTAPADDGDIRAALDDWTHRCGRIDHMLRDVATAARQWTVAGTAPSQQAFAAACSALADAVDAQIDDEEKILLPLLEEHLRPDDWAAIAASSHCRLSAREQLLVLGLALEDSCAAERPRLLDGLSRATRSAWRLYGGRRYRAAVVRLRGAPPAL